MRKRTAEPVSRETKDAGVVDISTKLAEAIHSSNEQVAKSTKEAAIDDARAIVFESANAVKPRAIDQDFRRVSEKIFFKEGIDVPYARLEKRLSLGSKVFDYSGTMEALDGVESDLRDAHRILVTAKLTFERWEKDNEVNTSVYRSEATKSLQREKDSGFRSKQITDADVNGRCSEMFPDEWKAAELERYEYKLTLDSLQNLVDVFASRCRTLQTAASKQR